MTEVERLRKAIERVLITAMPQDAGYYISSDTFDILKQALKEPK